jgi:hypothetical protein
MNNIKFADVQQAKAFCNFNSTTNNFYRTKQLYFITKYVKWAPEYVLDLRLFIFNKFPENGTLVPKHVVVGT